MPQFCTFTSHNKLTTKLGQYGIFGWSMFLTPQIDPASQVPLYKQLTDHIRASIISGRIAENERLPPTRELAGLLGLNRATVAAAYQALETEGYLKGHVGRGSFVQRGAAPAIDARRWEQVLSDPPAAALGARVPAISF